MATTPLTPDVLERAGELAEALAELEFEIGRLENCALPGFYRRVIDLAAIQVAELAGNMAKAGDCGRRLYAGLYDVDGDCACIAGQLRFLGQQAGPNEGAFKLATRELERCVNMARRLIPDLVEEA